MVLTPAARLLVARVSLIGIASLPAALVVSGQLASGPGCTPWFTDVDGRLPFVHTLRFFADMPSIVPMLAVAAALAVLGNQLLTAGALAIFGRDGGVGVLRSVRRDGMRHFGPFLRILALGVVASALAAMILSGAIDALGHLGPRRGWTAATMILVLPALRVLVIGGLLAKVGAWMLAARALTVADGRRRVRRTGLLALRLCWRAKFHWFGRFVVVTIATTVGSAAVLAAWFQSAPVGAALAGWLGLWALMVAVQAAAWLWLVHGAARLVDDPHVADLRGVPDTAFGWLSRLRRSRGQVSNHGVGETTETTGYRSA